MAVDSLSPVDGRYAEDLAPLGQCFSEQALMKCRVLVEIEWLIAMSESPFVEGVRPLTPEEIGFLRSIPVHFDKTTALQIKAIEAKTRHDVKAVEYFLKETLRPSSLADLQEYVHFTCTSEDINNLAYALMLKNGIQTVWLPMADRLVEAVAQVASASRDVAMLSHTHGQPATPTTLGKELAVFVYRWQRQLKQIRQLDYLGKFNGAVGSFNAQVVAYPEAPWEEIARSFVESLGLTYNPLTTQIEPHDFMAECFHSLARFNNIVLDFDQDMWLYISLGYFSQPVVAREVGSSTMPHKVNPINFENSEANVGLSNSLLNYLANKLPVSRLQRDLSDSSALRNVGVAIAHSYVALQSARRGFRQLSINAAQIEKSLAGNWEVLAEAIQTVMRDQGYPNPYEQLKALTRGAAVSREDLQAFILSLKLPEAHRQRLLALTPESYIGLAPRLVQHISNGADAHSECQPDPAGRVSTAD